MTGQSNVRTALNNQIRYIETGSQQVESMVESIRDLYPEVLRAAEGKGRNWISYRCPYNDEPYYRLQAQTKSGVQGQQLQTESGAFQTALEAVVQSCQALDTYFKLETYKTDQYAGALALMQEMPALVAEFSQSKQAYEAGISRLIPETTHTGPYGLAEYQLRRVMEFHRSMMSGFQYNFNEQVHTGWPQQEVLTHITQMQDLLDNFPQRKAQLNYPASAFYESCLGCARDFLESQRNYVDDYNIQAQSTDRHANDYYRQCLNTYNDCLVSFYNQFTDAAASDGFMAVNKARMVPVFAYKTVEVPPDKAVKIYRDTAAPALTVTPIRVTAKTVAALNTCVQYINECARKNNNLLTVLRNNGIHYRPFPDKNALYFNFETHTLPWSLLAEMERQSRSVPETCRPPLLLKARQLMDISVEMDGLRQVLVDFSKEKRWQREGFAAVENIRDRYVVLFDLFDQKKEQLYADIARIYTAYPADAATASTSWQRSYEALTSVVLADKALCTSVQAQSSVFPHEPVENAAVKAIQDEFTNMKGIEKLGRYNGLCPYTPYEDIGADSRRLAEYARTPERRKPADFTYLYNEIVEDYNRFVELSDQPFLKNTRQMDVFRTGPPPAARPQTAPVAVAKPPAEEVPSTKPTVQIAGNLRDTVYIRDTIYLEKPPAVNERFYSLEGFPANNLVFLLDVSGSMKTENRLNLLQSSIGRLVRLLREQDDIAVVSFSGKGQVLLPPTSGKKKDRILTTIDGLKPEGTTNIADGLKMAFQTARQNFKTDGNNRIVLATDGDFTLSEAMLEQIRQHAEAGISLSVFKFGSKPGQNLKTVSESGRGNLISITPGNAEIFMIREAQK
ncbi:MAG TPA: VWA domain-containing protein [Saprospiraceae bacterium]|nr:VWA domain-containing protein [Saprospiraceae bacterium]HPI07231.1 VWA domain-containing protein [Saprospiraceae bacterium]